MLYLPNEITIPVERNHSDIAKIGKQTDHGYEKLLDHVVEILGTEVLLLHT